MKKTLPNITAPTLVKTLPVSGIKIKYRPFIIKEQKALLLAQQSNDFETVLETLKDIVSTCTQGTVDFSKIGNADLAYFFIQLRIASVGDDVRFVLPCQVAGCDEKTVVNMSLEDVKISNPVFDGTVMLTDDVGIIFNVPSVDMTLGNVIKSDDINGAIKILYKMIDSVFDADSVYTKDDYSEEEFQEWLLNLNDKQLEKIYAVIKSVPELTHELTYTCPKCQTKQSRLLEGLHNFFRVGSDQ